MPQPTPLLEPSQDAADVLAGLRRFVAGAVEPHRAPLQPILDAPYVLHGPDGRLHPDITEARRHIPPAAPEPGPYHLSAPEDQGVESAAPDRADQGQGKRA